MRQLGRHDGAQTETQRRYIASAEKAARDEGSVDGAELIARIARLMRQEGLVRIEHAYQFAVRRDRD